MLRFIEEVQETFDESSQLQLLIAVDLEELL